MNPEPLWQSIPKPAEAAEERLITAILDGTFPIDSSLPGERELALLLRVTRPTLREVLQRTARDGWIEIRHGHSTRVRNYWQEGNLTILGAIAAHSDALPADFVANLLQVRLLLAPAYTRQSVSRSRAALLQLLPNLLNLADRADVYTQADWHLHQQLTILSGNPVFTLILNGFHDLYLQMGARYFEDPQSRAHSHAFYQALLQAVEVDDPAGAEALTRTVMAESARMWNALDLPR